MGSDYDVWIDGIGTVRSCIDCQALVGGGPSRCTRCARMSSLPPWKQSLLRAFGLLPRRKPQPAREEGR